MNRQLEIKEWFNGTYKQRGSLYLRPAKAYFIFAELLDVKPEDHLLDVACGLGRMVEAAEPYTKHLYGIDISDVAIKEAKKKFPDYNLQVANAEKLPFEDNVLDKITCLGSLERMLDLGLVFNEMQRISKNEAKFCFLVRNSRSFKWVLFKKWLRTKNTKGNQGANTLDEWSKLFEDNNFKIEQVLPDQWPIMKIKMIFNPFNRNLFKKVHAPLVPLEYASEFIFILSKKETGKNS